MEQADTDPAVRVVVVDSVGGVFSAGNDLADFAANNASGAELTGAPRLIAAMAGLGKPLIAAVEGYAVGIGFTLLLHCDLVFIAHDARLSAPFLDLGVTPEAGSSLLLPAVIGHQRAFAVFTLGQAIDGRTAVDWGLAYEAVEPGSAAAHAAAAAAALAAKPSAALVLTKRLMRDRDGLRARIAEEMVHFRACLQTPEAGEAFAAFFERRRPDFSRFR
jgi:enoyl-CoA hydratase/carnithine racemase